MSKLKDPLELFAELGIDIDSGHHNGRNIRYLEHMTLFEIGHFEFDRWANSVATSIDVGTAKGQRKLIRWIEE